MKPESLAKSGMIAALYAVLTLALAPVSYGPVQFRMAEALALLPFYMPEAIPGLFAGCFIANLFGGNGMIDVVLGSTATLAAASLSYKMPRLWLAALPPVLVNMSIVGPMLGYLSSLPVWLSTLQVGAGQAGVCYLAGYPLMKALEARGILKRRPFTRT